MPSGGRNPTTIYLDPKLAKAAKIKAAITGRSLSDLANEGLARVLREDDAILRIAKERRKQPSRDYEEFLKELRRDGLI